MARARAIREILLIVLVVLLLRLPFLNQAIQGDDVDYLASAQHAQIEPEHPNHFLYVFQGKAEDMQGHPHPPLNAWFLAVLLAVVGDVREIPFHAAYILFSLIAALAMWSLARRFSPHPVWATLLFVATPAFVVNGNSLESDLPFLALWMAGIALSLAPRCSGRAACFLALASLTAFQAILLTPLLGVYAWLHARRNRGAWALALVPPLTIAAWQLYELASTGKLPLAVLNGHWQNHGLQALANKLRNAMSLSVHASFLVFPVLLVPAFLVNRKRRDPGTFFLLAWVLIFFSGAVVIFYAGSARYLLPMAAPVALLVSRIHPRWLAAGFTLQMLLSLSLAHVNYQHWDGYRSFAASMKQQTASKRVWINGHWGLRYYFESDGGLPLIAGQAVRPGEMVVSSELALPVPFTTGGGVPTPVAVREIRADLPLRLLALHTRSAYSTVDRGFLPFDISNGPIDRVRADIVVERQPALEYLSMGAPEAEQQIVSGVYKLENGTRWTTGRAEILLKSPLTAKRLHASFYIPPQSPARRISILLDGEEVATETFSSGLQNLQSPPRKPEKNTVTVTILVDKTFSIPSDRRELGIVLSEVGFR